jgi:glycosyltransferase involved in cell wall biosynthesis
LLSLRLDEKILIGIAEHSKEWNLVLIGPEDDDFKRSRLHALPNVHFLGLKKPSELAAYVHYFDVCINPQIVNPLTIGNYPRKIDEYLSAGKPVVATETLAMQEFVQSTYLCKTINDFIEAINSALDSANNAELIQHRRDVAMKHTWTNSIRKLYKEINKLMTI